MQKKCSNRRSILIFFCILFIPGQVVFSQDHITKNNYTGAWETPASWVPEWPVPQTAVNNLDITINGYITVNGPLSFSGTCVLTINDTLVIKGDLSLANNCDFTINNNAILIVRGNLTVDKHVEMIANGYLIITGNIIKGGPNGEGSLTSNDNPVRVFVGGTIPSGLTDNNSKYPALDCTSPPTTPYPHSNCSYGDMTDIITDPIYPFFQSTCTTVTFTSSDADNSFCAGTSVTFTAGGGTNYNFRVNGTSVQNGGSTTYTTTTLTNGQIVDVIVTSTGGCTSTSSGITNTVFAIPTPLFTVQPGATACSATNVSYTTQPGQTSYVWTFSGVSGTDYSITSGGTGTDNTVTLKWLTAGSKTVSINYTNAGGCTAAAATSSTATLVTLRPTPTFTVQPGATACSATNVIYTTQAGQTSYVWTFTGISGTDYSITSGGTGTDNTVTLKWLTAGNKTVTINYTNAGGCNAAAATSSTATLVTLLPTPSFTAQPGATACSATNVIYTTQAGQTGYVWTFTGVSGTDYSITSGGTATDNTVTLKWLTAGSKTVTINYTNAGGCIAATATSSTATLVTLLPTPTISGPTPVCVSSSGNVYTTEAGMSNYTWSVSAGGTVTAGGGTGNNTVTVTWTTTGAKTVTANYTNGNGCIATSPTSYNVTVNPLTVPTIAGPIAVCIGATGNVYTTESGMSNYLWTVSAGGTVTAGGGTGNNNVTVTWTTTGAKTVTINYTNGNGCTPTSPTTYNVTVNPLPVPTITGPITVCAGVTGNLYTTEAGMSNYLWTVSAGGTITAGGGTGNNTVTVTWITTGTKTVTVNYTNSNVCTATSPTSYTVTINASPVATASNNGPVCAGSALSLTGGPAGMTSYSWTGPGGFTSNLQSPSTSLSATAAMTGVYTLTVTNASGCSSTASTTVTVNALPVATASNNGPVCIGNALSLTGGPAAMTTYAWTGSNGFTSSLQNPSVSDNATPAMAGVYTLKVTIAGGCINTATTTVTVNENPIANAGPDQELTFVFETQMAAELSPPETGEWALVSGSGHIITIHSPTTMLTELSAGENIFLWKVQNGSCKASAEVKITVHDLFIPSVITPDGDGKNDYFKISKNIGKVELIIFNRWGKEEYRNSNYLNDWDGHNQSGTELPYDTYFYILKLEDGIIRRGSVLILR